MEWRGKENVSGACAFVDHLAVGVNFIFGDCTRTAIATAL